MASAKDSGIGGAVSFPALDKAVEDAQLRALPREAAGKFQTYLNLLLKWNSKLNLTAIRNPEAIIQRHFVECIQCAWALPASEIGSSLLDFGSGAGLPGIPIAICRPEIRVVLAESQGKKASFLREAVRVLDLHAEVFDGRVEQMDPESRFDIVTLRAVDKMEAASRVALNRLKMGGWMVAFTTDASEPELKTALPEVSWKRNLRIFGLDQGILLLGQLPD